MQPHEYPRRILLCVVGTTPQIITETLYAVARGAPGRAPFVPTEIRVLTTAEGANQAKLSLLAHDRNQFGKLCAELGLSGIHFDAGCIDVLTDAHGVPMTDIRTPAQNEAAADQITRRVAELARDEDVALHCSIAGGRKTMGFYLGYALSLFGRQQDRMSHVLVTEGFEGHPEFFFIPNQPRTLQLKNGREISTADAEIHLAEIPFIPMSSNVHRSVVDDGVGFAQAVGQMRAALSGGELRVLPRERGAWFNGVRLDLSQKQFVILHWLAKRRLCGSTEGGGVLRSALQFTRGNARNEGLWQSLFDVTECAFGRESSEYDMLLQDEQARKLKPAWISPTITYLNDAIEAVSGPLARKHHGVLSEGKKGELCYRLGTPVERITVGD